MASVTGRVWVGFLLGLAVAGVPARGASAQTPGADGLARFVPKDAMVFIERRGHAAVREAMLASNFGAMASDETMLTFFNDSRVRVGKQIVKDLFDLKQPPDIAARQKQLHEVLMPFWDQPAAFCTVGQKERSSTTMIFLCATGAYQASCRKALGELMKIDVPAEGVPGAKQAFTYRKGEVLWKGILKRREPFVLPKAPDERTVALANGSAFMVCWVDDLLVVTTGVPGADAMSGMLSVTAPAASLGADKTYQAVAARTSIKDWAFRWHASVPAVMGLSAGEGDDDPRHMPREMKALGFDRVLAIGGSEGYADKLVTRRLLVYAPQADLTMRLIRPGGSYRRGLAMSPRGAMVSLSGEIDTGVLTRLIAATSVPREERPEDAPATRPASAPANPVGEAISQLVLAGDGNASAFLQNLSIIGLGGGDGSVPGGLVMGLKDPVQARQAVEQLVRLVPVERAGEKEDKGVPATQGATRPAPAPPGAYRGEVIHRAGSSLIVILKDRVVIAFSRAALTAAVDAALDNVGGLPPGGKTVAMADLEGEGALLARIDMARLTGTFLPLVGAFFGSNSDFPLAPLPPTNKIVSMLGSEVVVFQATDCGILLKSRGHVPLLTKLPMMGYGVPYFFFRGLF